MIDIEMILVRYFDRAEQKAFDLFFKTAEEADVFTENLEWSSHSSEKVRGETLSDGRIIYKNKVYPGFEKVKPKNKFSKRYQDIDNLSINDIDRIIEVCKLKRKTINLKFTFWQSENSGYITGEHSCIELTGEFEDE